MIKHYYRAGYEFLEDTATGEVVSKPENDMDYPPEHAFMAEDLFARLAMQEDEDAEDAEDAGDAAS